LFRKQQVRADGVLRRARRLLILTTVSILAVLGTPAVALANGTWSNSAPAQCSTIWYHNTWGATATLHYQYTADTDQTNFAHVTNSKAWIDSMMDCGPEGRPVTAYRVDVSAQFWIYANSINCSLGIAGSGDLSVSCQPQTNDVFVTLTTTCMNVRSCTINMPSLYFYPNDGAKIKNYMYMGASAVLYDSAGNAQPVQVERM
jgi:hypothetical protein